MCDEVYILFHFNNTLKHKGMSSTEKNQIYPKFYVILNIYFLFYFKRIIFVNFIIFYTLRPHLHSIIHNTKTHISCFFVATHFNVTYLAFLAYRASPFKDVTWPVTVGLGWRWEEIDQGF